MFTMVVLSTLISPVYPRGLKEIEDGDDKMDQLDFLKIFDQFSRTKENSRPFALRRSNSLHSGKFTDLRNIIRRGLRFRKPKQIKRYDEVHEDILEEDEGYVITKDELGKLVETELQNALAKKSSALSDRPYVKKSGRNDFLVIRPDIGDPFVTIIPNDIYHMKEKKCVNWLEDCNAEGIRGRLLQKVMSP